MSFNNNEIGLAGAVQFGDMFLGSMMLLTELISHWVNVSNGTWNYCFYHVLKINLCLLLLFYGN